MDDFLEILLQQNNISFATEVDGSYGNTKMTSFNRYL